MWNMVGRLSGNTAFLLRLIRITSTKHINWHGMRICYRSNFDPRPHDFKANSRGENRMEDVESCLGKKRMIILMLDIILMEIRNGNSVLPLVWNPNVWNSFISVMNLIVGNSEVHTFSCWSFPGCRSVADPLFVFYLRLLVLFSMKCSFV